MTRIVLMGSGMVWEVEGVWAGRAMEVEVVGAVLSSRDLKQFTKHCPGVLILL
jgi:hypothetical protein